MLTGGRATATTGGLIGGNSNQFGLGSGLDVVGDDTSRALDLGNYYDLVDEPTVRRSNAAPGFGLGTAANELQRELLRLMASTAERAPATRNSTTRRQFNNGACAPRTRHSTRASAGHSFFTFSPHSNVAPCLPHALTAYRL